MNSFSKFFNKKLLFYSILFIISFCIIFFVTYVCMPLNYDEVWTYGFSYNVSQGLVIYRDFNVVTTPLYYFINCIFIKIFGDHIISSQIFNSILSALMILLMFKTIRWKALIAFSLIFIFCPNGYNLFSLFWLMLILYLIVENKDNDILVGLILGLAFITKQNIGFILLIPYLYYSRNRLKSIIVFMIPFAILAIYLLLNDAFYEFIDYCFLGLLDFGNNGYFNYYCIIELIALIYLLFKLLKSRFKDKEIFYILMFQIMVYPLPDDRHVFTALVPVIYYILKDITDLKILITMCWGIFIFNVVVLKGIEIDIHLEKDIFFLKNNRDINIALEGFHDYLKDAEHYYFLDYYAYMYKLYYNIPINNYDLWNEGNQGYNGIEKRINEVDNICANNKCLFIVNNDLKDNENSQLVKVYNYVINNYHIIWESDDFSTYSNAPTNINVGIIDD